MAADKATLASGADTTEGLRKRPVPAGQAAPAPALVEVDDKKKKAAKKVRATEERAPVRLPAC